MPEQTPASATNQPATRFQCRHLRAAGARCGSPALRHEHFCFYHHASRRPVPAHPYPDADREPFAFPVVEDRAEILLALSQVLARIAANDLDPKRAGLLLYGLQVAATVLPKEPSPNLTSPNPSHPNPSPKHPAPSPRNPLQPQALPTTIADPTDLDDLTFDPALGPLAPVTELPEPTPQAEDTNPEEEDQTPPKTWSQRFLEQCNTPPKPTTIPTLQASAQPKEAVISTAAHGAQWRDPRTPLLPPNPHQNRHLDRSARRAVERPPHFGLCPPPPTNSRHLDRSAQRAAERPPHFALALPQSPHQSRHLDRSAARNPSHLSHRPGRTKVSTRSTVWVAGLA